MKTLAGLTFRSGLLTTSEFHAGHNFFGIVYRDYLSFGEGQQVVLSKKVVLPFNPLDPSDIQWFNNYYIEGSYSIKDGFIECRFEQLEWIFRGIISDTPGTILILSNFDERLRKSWSVVYEKVDSEE